MNLVNKKLKSIYIVVTLITMMLILTGCRNNTQEENRIIEGNQVENIQNNIAENEVIEEEKSSIKNGKYKMVVQNQSEEVPEEVIYVDIYNGELKLIDVYARITQAGTYEIEGNKLIGKYNEITYFDQNTNSMLEKEISNELEFEILEDGTLKDNIGFGIIFGEPLYKGEVYKLEIE